MQGDANSSKGCANNTFLVSAHPNKFLRQKIRKAAQPKKRRKYVSIDKLHASSSEYETQTLHLRQALPNSVAFFLSIFSATTTFSLLHSQSPLLRRSRSRLQRRLPTRAQVPASTDHSVEPAPREHR